MSSGWGALIAGLGAVPAWDEACRAACIPDDICGLSAHSTKTPTPARFDFANPGVPIVDFDDYLMGDLPAEPDARKKCLKDAGACLANTGKRPMHGAGPGPSGAWGVRGEIRAPRPDPTTCPTPAGESIVMEDLVAWVTIGVQHVPRSEDVPLISNFGANFFIKVSGWRGRRWRTCASMGLRSGSGRDTRTCHFKQRGVATGVRAGIRRAQACPPS